MTVSSAMPYLDIKTTNAKIEIHREPLRLVVEREPPKLHVRRTRPQMKVNWQKVRDESGLRSPAAQRKYMQQLYRQKALESISKISNTYDAYTDIQQVADGGPEIVATIELQHQLYDDIPVVNVASMPASFLEVEWEPGELEFEWEPGKLKMHWEGDFRPEITVTPYSVEIRLANGKTVRVGENSAKILEKQGQGRRVDKRV